LIHVQPLSMGGGLRAASRPQDRLFSPQQGDFVALLG
jgi:hypothetical protein